eukprot:TRINITY_DN5950_c0_g1_i11.p1 TRINITY_DN5950_c0_g1~~TRINITY_DN5950_c0_g1_i11.p1  ORF type:complete len:430 (-),score=106.37 TRINITY_DN5950_c0_g1_i11:83-1372(-)
MTLNSVKEKTRTNLSTSSNLITDEEWEKLTDELDLLFTHLHSNSEFRNGIKEMFSVCSIFAEKVSSQPSDRVMDSIQKEAKELVGQFSGEEEMDTLVRRIRHLTSSLMENQEAQLWWATFREQVLQVVGTYKGKEDLNKFREIFDKCGKIFQDYQPKIIKIVDSMGLVITNITNDEYVARLKESLSMLTTDLFWNDQDGNSYFDTEAAGILVSAIGGVIRNQFTYLALPKVVHRDSSTAYTLDNLVITATLPDKIDFHLETDLSLDLAAIPVPDRKAIKTEIFMTADIKGIRAQALNTVFTYEGTTISESGVMDATIGNSNLSLDFVMRPGTGAVVGSIPTSSVRYEFLRIKARFRIKDMDIKFHTDTLSHPLLVPMLTSLFKGSIRDRVESGIEEAMDEGLVSLGKQVVDILNQAPRPLSIPSLEGVI